MADLERARQILAQLRAAEADTPRVGAFSIHDLQLSNTWSPRVHLGAPKGEADKLERAIKRVEQAEAALERTIQAIPPAAFRPPPGNAGRRRRTAGARGAYQVEMSRKAEKSMSRLAGDVSQRVVNTIAKVTRAPWDNADSRITNTAGWTGFPYLFMARVGKYRVLYWIDDSSRTITVVDVLVRNKLPGGVNGR